MTLESQIHIDFSFTGFGILSTLLVISLLRTSTMHGKHGLD